MEEMKNLIIQSLETKGVLGQIRAHLRSSVFKIVDEQDQQFNMGCGLKWENPTLYKILETKIGTLLAEVIREFMEFFRMDYSLSIFIPECGISPERLKKEEIFGKMGILPNDINDKFTNGMQLPLLYYIMYYFIDGLKNNPEHLIETISKAQDDIEKKTDEIIDSNIVEYLKNQRGNEDEEIPLSNNDREQQNLNNKNIKKSFDSEELKRDEEEENVIKEKIDDKKKKKNEEDIDEEIVDELDDSGNKGSGNYTNSQTASAAQIPDKTVESGELENFNYIEDAQKKKT